MNSRMRREQAHAQLPPEGNGRARESEEHPQSQGPHPRHAPYVPWDLRFHARLVSIFLRPKRWQRFRRWAASAYPQTRRFVVAVTSGRVAATAWAARNNVCAGCDTLILQIQRDPNRPPIMYCGSCRCGRWFMAALKRKNWWRKAYCPLQLHAGVYPDTRYQELVKLDIEERASDAGMETDDSNSSASPDGTDQAVRQGDVAASVTIN